MRMWMVDPQLLCRRHLLGEHVECHMFEGTWVRDVSMKGYIDGGLFQPADLHARHDALAAEMARRGMNHKSPMHFTAADFRDAIPAQWLTVKVDANENLKELARRCPACAGIQAAAKKGS